LGVPCQHQIPRHPVNSTLLPIFDSQKKTRSCFPPILLNTACYVRCYSPNVASYTTTMYSASYSYNQSIKWFWQTEAEIKYTKQIKNTKKGRITEKEPDKQGVPKLDVRVNPTEIQCPAEHSGSQNIWRWRPPNAHSWRWGPTKISRWVSQKG
jgi:hypothetical protein